MIIFKWHHLSLTKCKVEVKDCYELISLADWKW